jgi:hypothetical protein
MSKNTEYDLILAIMEICREDTGAGGLVPLTGKAVPVVRVGDLGMNGRLPPIMAVYPMASSLNLGLPESLNIVMATDAFAKANSEGLEYTLLERFDEVVTTTNLLAKGLDAASFQMSRPVMLNLEDGRRQVSAEYLFTLKR